VSTAAATRMLPPPAKGAKGTLPWRVDVTIIGRIHEAIVGATVVPTIASCVHCIIHRMTYGRHGSKEVVLIMLCRGAKQSGHTGWSASDEVAVQAEHQLNLAIQIGKMATRIDRWILATSDPLIESGRSGCI